LRVAVGLVIQISELGHVSSPPVTLYAAIIRPGENGPLADSLKDVWTERIAGDLRTRHATTHRSVQGVGSCGTGPGSSHESHPPPSVCRRRMNVVSEHSINPGSSL
jgi:hypothetical protein